MRRLLPFVVALPLLAQAPVSNLDKPPQDVDDALRARIKQFYDYHVEATASAYRRAEQLVAEDSKDDYYIMSKVQLKSYRIGNIEYFDNFTKAKVVIVGAMPALLPMAGAKIMDFPFASYWKSEKGIWWWYYNKEAAKETPFGHKEHPDNPNVTATAAPTPPDPAKLLAALQSALKIDKNRVDIAPGESQTIHVTNTLPGPATVSIASPYKPIAETGITATFDKKDLKGNETAALTLSADGHMTAQLVPLVITVTPTNQVLNLMVNVSPH